MEQIVREMALAYKYPSTETGAPFVRDNILLSTPASRPMVGRMLSAIFRGESGLSVVGQTSYGFASNLLVHVHDCIGGA
jgi:hypothetical protein